MTNNNTVKTPLNLNELARQRLKGFARNHGLELTGTDRNLFIEDFWSYTKNYGKTFDEAVELACQAVLLSHS